MQEFSGYSLHHAMLIFFRSSSTCTQPGLPPLPSATRVGPLLKLSLVQLMNVAHCTQSRFIEIQFTKLTKLNRFTFGGNSKWCTITIQSKSDVFC